MEAASSGNTGKMKFEGSTVRNMIPKNMAAKA
jgi:hypothetical protein